MQGIDEQTINRVYDIFYGLDEQRIKTVYDDFSISGHVKTRYYFGTYEKETDEFGNITETDYLYTPAGLTAMRRKTSSGAGLYYIHTDLLGSIERITNATGQIVSEYTYTPWGGRVLLSGVNITDRGYTGHEHLSPFGDDSNGGFCLINMNACGKRGQSQNSVLNYAERSKGGRSQRTHLRPCSCKVPKPRPPDSYRDAST